MALVGKLVVITGGADGIGRAVCKLFAKEEARVVACDIDFQGVQETVKSLIKKDENQNHLAVLTDISSSKSVEDLGSRILQVYGKEIPSVVVNVAAVQPNMHGMAGETEESFDRVMAVNLKGTFLIDRKFALMMKDGNIPGSIVNVSSITVHGLADGPAYAASKGGVSSLTKSFAKEMAKDGIRFNTVLPGVTDTRIAYKTNMTGQEVERFFQKAPHSVPMGRLGSPEEIAEVCLFLASDRSSYVTCSEYEVHGGLHAVTAGQVETNQ